MSCETFISSVYIYFIFDRLQKASSGCFDLEPSENDGLVISKMAK